MLIIDAHAHVYAEEDAKYPPIDNPIRPPGKAGSVRALEALARNNSVTRVCAIHPLSFYGWDNRFICDVSKEHPTYLAAICSLNPEDNDSPMLLDKYVTSCGVRGLRSYATSDACLDHPGMRALWTKAELLGITVNVFINWEKEDDLARMLEQFPRLAVVIDHCLVSKPSPDSENAFAALLRLAKFTNAYAKLSFLPLGSTEPYPFCDMHEPCMRIIAAFGPERCVWGNCFPCEVWSPRSTYSQNLRIFTHELKLQNSTKEWILGRTALHLWFKDRPQLR